jgi:hypothetical protein
VEVWRLFVREIKAEFHGRRIIVRNSWGIAAVNALMREGFASARKALGDETKLYLDGKLVDSTNDLILLSSAALLRARIEEQGKCYDVEVYARAGWLKNLIKLCIDGERIAGDNF